MKFRGAHNINLDAKGRLAIPTRLREFMKTEFDSQLVITVDTDLPRLRIYPLPEWERIEEQLQNLPSYHSATNKVRTLLIGHASEVEMDANGRILIPPPLRQFAKLDKKSVLLGQGKSFELWDEDTWVEVRDGWMAEGTLSQGGENLPEQLLNLSL